MPNAQRRDLRLLLGLPVRVVPEAVNGMQKHHTSGRPRARPDSSVVSLTEL